MEQTTTKRVPTHQMRTVTMPVEGMTCASCVLRVEKALKKVNGVEEASVNLATEQATVTFDATRAVPKEMATAVEEAGYRLYVPHDDIGEGVKNDHAGMAARTEDVDIRHGEAYKRLRSEFIFSLYLTVPITVLSMLSMTEWFMLAFPFSMDSINRLLFIATSLVVVVSGKRFYRSAWQLAKRYTADMNTLVAIGTGVSYIYSSIVVLFPHLLNTGGSSGTIYFDTTATIITLILMGRVLEARAKRRTSEAMKKLMTLQPTTALVKRGGIELDIDINTVAEGDIVIVHPGGQIPVDGIIVQGSATIDESMVTGESLPVRKLAGDNVVGGTINTDGSIEFRTTAVGKDTVIARIIRIVEEAQGSKPTVQALADKIASVFVPIVVGVAVITFVGWYFWGGVGFSHAMINFIAVLIIACPCALGLATPTAVIVGTGAGASMGVLIRNTESLQRLHRVDTIVFDKTGTITDGKLAVTAIRTLNGFSEDLVLQRAASVEQRSEHPTARAITNFARQRSLGLTEARDFRSFAGHGVSANIGDDLVAVGNGTLMEMSSVETSVAQPISAEVASTVQSFFYIAINGVLAGIIGVADSIRPTARQAIEKLGAMNIHVIMMTGDHDDAARAIGAKAGVVHVISRVSPEGKAGQIEAMTASDKIVAVVGDGINDAPALAVASVGIAMGTGTDVAKETADITLMNSDLLSVVKAIQLSKRTMKCIRQNLFWAFIYNLVGIPLAAFGLLNPVVAALAMALSSVSVVLNSLRLRYMVRSAENGNSFHR